MERKRRESIRYLRPRALSKVRRIEKIFHWLSRERGESAEKIVFQVLEDWLSRGLILSYSQSPKWGYDDYIRHIDGWLMTLNGEMLDFQIKSSQRSAEEYSEKHPGISVIVVRPGISLEELDQQMRRLFKDELPKNIFCEKG